MPFDSRDKKVGNRLSREIGKTARLVARIRGDREARRHTEITPVLVGFRRINAILARGIRAGTVTPAQEKRIGTNFVTMGKALSRTGAPKRKTRSKARR